jgi:hypothetical protein
MAMRESTHRLRAVGAISNNYLHLYLIGLIEGLAPLGRLSRAPQVLFGFYVPIDLSAPPHLFRSAVQLQIARGALFVA